MQALDLRTLFFDEPSVTATEHILMAAVLAEGETTLLNAAGEPHVQDLVRLLNAMGAEIEGAGSNTLRIRGVAKLGGARHRVVSDHIEAGSYTLTAEDDTTVRKVEVLAAGQAIRVVVDGWGKWAVELIPTQEEHRFLTAWLRDGELYDVEDQAPFVFDMDGGRAVGFRVINATENTTWMTGTRTN